MINCRKCDTEKPQEEFYPRNLVCKECTRAQVKANKEANKEYYRMMSLKKSRSGVYKASVCSKEARNKASAKYYAANKHKALARGKVGRALKSGKLVKPEKCSECQVSSDSLDGHHDDYSKPLEVRWLCEPCHYKAHRRIEIPDDLKPREHRWWSQKEQAE